ncbi:MAG: hypothetical protein FWE94_00735 [Coriobacteriia bacterium]|nr:hypothetical protein [Coriobacteriia bacterium]
MTEPAALLELQSIDLELIQAKRRLDGLPEKAAILAAREKIKETTALREKAGLLLRKLEAELKARQDETDLLVEKITAEQEKLTQIADHRMVNMITRQVDGFKRRTGKLEVESLQFMERIEKATAQIATIEEALVKMADSEAGLVKRFKKAGGALQADIAAKEAARTEVVKMVSEGMLARYESMRAAKGGIGVGRLAEAACSACHMQLPATKVRQLEEGDDVGVCPACRRLIVVRTGDNAQGTSK